MMQVSDLVHQALLFTVLFWSSALPALAAITNRTIDDTFGDSVTARKVVYLPKTPGVWTGAECTTCFIRPDNRQANNETYTAATYFSGGDDVSFSLNFHGTAIYVFFILANSAEPGVPPPTAANFTLDDQPPQLKVHTPDVTSKNFQYNALLYSQTGLPVAQHFLSVSMAGDTDGYINFDYAIYTHDDSDLVDPSLLASAPTSVSSTSVPFTQPSTTAAPPVNAGGSKVNSGAIAGGLGALLAVALVVAILFLLHRRQKRLDTEQLLFRKDEIDPAEPSNSKASDDGYSTLSSESGHPYSAAASINPFDDETASVASITRLPLQAEDPYGGYLTPISIPVVSYPNNPYSTLPAKDQRQPLQLVNRGSVVPTLAGTISDHEDLRRARQEELSRQLTEMQQEMQHLSSGLHDHTSGTNGAGSLPPEYVKRISARAARHLKTPAGMASNSSSRSITAVGGRDDDAEVGAEDMQELVRSLRLQIESLQLQQQSAWAQGLSDDPPPGYTPRAARRMS